MKKFSPLFFLALGCQAQGHYKTIGTIERLDPAIDAIIEKDAKIEIIAEGFDWSEGPLWLESQQLLLFSDVPANTIYKWTEKKGKEVYLTPSGYTGTEKRGGETGSNGLLLDPQGRLVLCQHGNRQMARMNAPLDQPAPRFIPIASQFQDKKLNSPNDAVFNSAGELYFTDPPYGLEKNMKDPKKEIPFQGVYKVDPQGEVILLTDSISRPNGIAIFPGGKKILIANSDPNKPYIYQYELDDAGTLKNASIFFDAGSQAPSRKGLPDGLKIDSRNNVFATGPGGVYIFDGQGKWLGRIHLENAASNCALTADEKTLFITNDMYVLRVKMR
ncbi:MAG TPA: SMP-30/gluconolactonase/LRE family protein [Chitinophagaceae bacterium]|nr:SMP-30/gluconolactonase/LRE family protein [Chitinophagaceae bacterium]